ncbi:DUF6893 family small protein [Streptomyces shenzhenensis]
MKKIVLGALTVAAAAAAALVVQSLPDLRRYLRIRSM